MGAIVQVAHDAWRDTYRSALSPAAITDVLSRWYSSDSMRQRVNRGLDVVERDAGVCGYAQHGPLGEEVHEVFAIYVHPSVRGQGAGWALWQAVNRAALAAGCASIELWVLEDNPIGRRWYDRQGGAIVGSRVLQFLDGERNELRYRFLLERSRQESIPQIAT